MRFPIYLSLGSVVKISVLLSHHEPFWWSNWIFNDQRRPFFQTVQPVKVLSQIDQAEWCECQQTSGMGGGRGLTRKFSGLTMQEKYAGRQSREEMGYFTTYTPNRGRLRNGNLARDSIRVLPKCTKTIRGLKGRSNIHTTPTTHTHTHALLFASVSEKLYAFSYRASYLTFQNWWGR